MAKLTTQQKIEVVGDSEEVTDAVKLLITLMDDANIENYLTIDYEALGNKYELRLTKEKP